MGVESRRITKILNVAFVVVMIASWLALVSLFLWLGWYRSWQLFYQLAIPANAFALMLAGTYIVNEYSTRVHAGEEVDQRIHVSSYLAVPLALPALLPLVAPSAAFHWHRIPMHAVVGALVLFAGPFFSKLTIGDFTFERSR